jgi:hypothetical protein
METVCSAKVSRVEGKEKMFKLLDEYEKSNLSIKSFCFEHNIAPATFHYWKKKYNTHTVNQPTQSGFASLHITTTSPAAIFAEVHGIKIYQWVTAAYLKDLLA